jgi:hypothetical protein
MALMETWSARTCPRFGTGRHVSQFQSGDMSPHSKSVDQSEPKFQESNAARQK